MNSRKYLATMTLVLLSLLVLIGCGGDDGTGPQQPNTTINGALTMPASWAGEWTWTVRTLNCATDQLYSVDEITDTYNAGDTLDLVISNLFSNSSGTIISDSLIVTCVDTIVDTANASPCDAILTLVINAGRVGDTVTGVGQANLVLEGFCGATEFEAGCEKYEITGVRAP